jgi:tetratricopeptide (TPR) repeat protein
LCVSSLLTLHSLLAQATPQTASCAVQPAPPVTEGDQAFAAGKFAKAESLYMAAIASAPSIAAYDGLMRVQLEQNKLTDGISTAQKAAAAMPASADAQALSGLALLRDGQISEASGALTKAFGLDHCSALALYGLGKFNDLLSRHLTASHEFANARRIAPWNPSITAAWILTLPTGPAPGDDTRTPTLHAFLATKPLLPPAMLARLTTTLGLLEAHASCTPVEPLKAPVNLTIDGLMLFGTHARSWGVKGRINNVDLPLFELDTSVAGIVLNPADAKKAGVHPLTTANPNGIYTAIAERVRIGPLEYLNCPVRVAPAPSLANSNSLIGTDFFRDQLIKIDYPGRRVTLTPYPDPVFGLTDRTNAPYSKDWISVYTAGSNLLIPTLINQKGPVLLLLDTGSSRTILAPNVNSKVLLKMRDKDSNIHGSSGEIVKTVPKYGGSEMEVSNPEVKGPDGEFLHVTSPLKVPVLRFGNNEFVDESVLSFDLTPKSHDTGVEIGGLMGFVVLREYYIDIDYRNGLVKLQYDDKHLYVQREGVVPGRDDAFGAVGPNP